MNTKSVHRCLRYVLSLSLLLALLGTSSVVKAQTVYSAFDDFSGVSNPTPNGVWSYGYTATLGGPLTLYTSTALRYDPSLTQWTNGTNVDPNVIKNETGHDISVSDFVIPATNYLYFHPSPNGDYSVVRWTAPHSGNFEVDTIFRAPVNACPTTSDVHVLHNNVSLFDALVEQTTNMSDQGPRNFTIALALSAGDTIDFVVGVGSNSDFGCDRTLLQATIGQVTSPNTPSGDNITVSPATGASITFSLVSSAGNTTLTTSNTGPTPPSGFGLGNQPTFYYIATTAVYTLPVAVCLAYDSTQYSELNPARLLHYANNAWTDVTTSNDTTNHIVCGQVNSLAFFVIAKTVAAQTIYSAFDDFSGTSNPTLSGIWRYGYTTTLGGPLILYSSTALRYDPSLTQWTDGHREDPNVIKNEIGQDISIPRSGHFIIPATEYLYFHPGANGDYSVVRWTAPSYGNFTVDFIFRAPINTCPTTADIHVLHNNISLFDALVEQTTNMSDQDPRNFTTVLALSAGDTIDFVAGVGSDSSYSCDRVLLKALLTKLGAAPTADFSNITGAINEGQFATLSFSNQRDAVSSNPTDFIYSYDCANDGTFERIDIAAPSYDCSYLDDGTFTPKGRIKNISANFTDYTSPVIVNNVPPVTDMIIAPIDPVQVNSTVSTTVSFTDPGVLDTHTAIWDWGDNTTSIGTVVETNGSGSVTGSHTYTSPGVYTVKVIVTDDDGDSVESIFQYVVVYDPIGGFVTGAGVINSPLGAYTFDLSLAGIARFGFVSKYVRGAATPTGQTQFRFQMADLNFQSTSYDWLVVAGAKAQFKGSGTINGMGNYGFMLTAIDGVINSKGGADKFRIKIWDKATGQVIYDNQLGASDTAEPTTAIQGGSIVVHK